MAISKALSTSLLFAALFSAGGAHAATQLVSNGSFSSITKGNANSWSDNNVSFVDHVAIFDKEGDRLTQSFAGLQAAGTSLAMSFDFAAPGNGSSNVLRFVLQTSTSPTFASGLTNRIVGTYTSSSADGTKTFSPIVLDKAGYVRISFVGLSDTKKANIDNVSLLATAPVPEPETYALMLAGLGVVGFAARRRRPQD
jgi:hypothetical protein